MPRSKQKSHTLTSLIFLYICIGHQYTIFMKITVLNANIASGICKAAHGLSWFVEAEKNILFDAGPSSIAFENAEKIGIDPNDADLIVLSHGHWDHGNGLEFMSGGKLIAHPEIHRKRYKESNGRSIGLDLPQKDIEDKFDVMYSKSHLQLFDGAWFLGEIHRINQWDSGHEDFILEDQSPDNVPDDTGIVLETQKGLVVISGCAHSGITNIVLKAMEIMPGKPVHAVMGGFHLKPGDPRLQRTIDFFKKLGIKKLYPSHCTAVEVISQMREVLPVKFVKSGNVFNF